VPGDLDHLAGYVDSDPVRPVRAHFAEAYIGERP
jgi:hypothetical protein